MRDMENLNQDQARQNGWKVLVDLECEVIGKAVLRDENNGIDIMKSTKRFKVEGGWIYNTSTEVHKSGGQVSIAEALVFVPAITGAKVG
jgi:hypothetical protein